MSSDTNYNRLEYWIEEQQSKGKLAFSIVELKKAFVNDSEIALKRALDRLSEKEKIVSVFKGYYVIVPPQYSAKGILPPVLFIDGLMKFLERNYYISLLNAGALHGAGHQQPQEYFIITKYPVLRPTNKRGIKINYISTKQLPPETLLEKKKTETGYINVSNPILTAIDLINYEKRIGGLNRAVTVINELLENIKPKDITQELVAYASATTLQRFGFILEEVLGKKNLADKLLLLCKKADTKFYLIPLKASGEKAKEPINEEWKIVINTDIETDF
ncbi:MAG: type IV toxin-antitoxin system AbiEi family antitoxin [Bacteroidia bacterium]|nr:type IV toxin-antitoxin system AbiEi family antitoxin [Bacteroidia bacterium]